MRVFISWSGERSHEVAVALRWWLPHIIQIIEPLTSEDDIKKGTRWRSDLADLLKDTKFGIVCLTPENQEAPWIMFESGALSKDKNPLWTFLFGFEKPTDVKSSPLADINHTMANVKEDVHKLIKDINSHLGDDALPEKLLDEQFSNWWPELEKRLSKIKSTDGVPTKRDADDMIEEILERVRAMSRKEMPYEMLGKQLVLGHFRQPSAITEKHIVTESDLFKKAYNSIAEEGGTHKRKDEQDEK